MNPVSKYTFDHFFSFQKTCVVYNTIFKFDRNARGETSILHLSRIDAIITESTLLFSPEMIHTKILLQAKELEVFQNAICISKKSGYGRKKFLAEVEEYLNSPQNVSNFFFRLNLRNYKTFVG